MMMKMKGKYVIGGVLVLLFCFLFGLRASADEPMAFRVRGEDGEYVLVKERDGGQEEILRSASFSSVLDVLNAIDAPSLGLTFETIAVDEPIVLSSHTYTLSGDLVCTAKTPVTVADGASVTLSGATFRLSGGLRVKDGSLRLISGEVSAPSCAVALDYTSSAEFVMTGGSLTSDGDCAIRVALGTARIGGGTVTAAHGVAIRNTASLVLSASPILNGADADISTERPVSLRDGSTPFAGEADVRFERTFEYGHAFVAFYGATAETADRIHLTDADNNPCDLTYFSAAAFTDERQFLAVYRPYSVTYYVDSDPIGTDLFVAEEPLSLPTAPTRTGYSFLGWFYDREGNTPFSGASVSADLSLYAKYTLDAPSFSLSSLSFVYDGESRSLTFSLLSHPLSDGGVFTYTWYRDGALCENSSPALPIRNVADSGIYYCAVTFTYASDSVTVTTPAVTVRVEKKCVDTPTIPFASYTGAVQTASVYAASEYTVSENQGGIHSGLYPVVLTLTDPANTRFRDTESADLILTFEIRRADNGWVDLPAVSDAYLGSAVNARATARFGTVEFLYARSPDAAFSSAVPDQSGVWYMKAVVAATSDYTGLSGDPIAFNVLTLSVTGLRVLTPPDRIDYTAFERFCPDGMTVYATYSDGSTAPLPVSSLTVSYASGGTCLRFGDRTVLLAYAGVTVPVSVTVSRASYDLSALSFSDGTAEYDGTRHDLPLAGSLPVGLDGIVLGYTISGGGVDAGRYTVTVTFSTASRDYECPPPMNAVLTVTPWTCEITWSETVFVYDGTLKLPRATYTDRQGIVHALTAEGGAVAAGDGYLATVSTADRNIVFTNPTCTFEIRKAVYDMTGVHWSEGAFTYDGTAKTVTLLGLPSGVSVIGYVDHTATDAGVYHPGATLSYDARNYETPILPTGRLVIAPAEFDLSGVSFPPSSFVYDGTAHTPEIVGVLPMGVDGSTLSVAFDTAVTHVAEGVVTVTVTLTPTSGNYLAPSPIQTTVSVTPQPVYAVWTSLDFVYDGLSHLPTAVCPSCPLTLSGAARNAGEYTAVAVSSDPDFMVVNDQVIFRIERAENAWLIPLTVSDLYESATVAPYAKAQVGAPVYQFFADAAATQAIDMPTSPGIYYVRAAVLGQQNYCDLISAPVAFTICAVLPVSLCVTLQNTVFAAYDILSASDVQAYLENNDGSVTPLPFSALTVSYASGDSLRVTDHAVSVTAGEFSVSVPLSVSRYSPDLSDFVWNTDGFVYDKAAHTVTLTECPDPIRVGSYDGNLLTDAGTYTVTVHLLFDAENVDAPAVLTHTVTVSRAPVPTPTLPSSVYDGTVQAAVIPPSPLYTADPVFGTHAGMYTVLLRLIDPENYVWEEIDSDTLTALFRIDPRPIEVELDDLTLYRDAPIPEVGFRIVAGEVVSGDDLGFYPVLNGGIVTAQFQNGDYDVTVHPGRVIDTGSLSAAGRAGRLCLILFLILVALAVAVVLTRRSALKSKVQIVRALATRVPLLVRPRAYPLAPPPGALVCPITDPLRTVDPERADTLITDALARDLIRRVGDTVSTFGRRRTVINIDTLSAAFRAGDRVDVNILKRMGLIPYDTAFLKILARGVLDKPLTVCANDFSLAAVKMIALTGGEAVRVRTVRTKTREK